LLFAFETTKLGARYATTAPVLVLPVVVVVEVPVLRTKDAAAGLVIVSLVPSA
jgi:hypothetical protein